VRGKNKKGNSYTIELSPKKGRRKGRRKVGKNFVE
jgi:hypothetical protein